MAMPVRKGFRMLSDRRDLSIEDESVEAKTLRIRPVPIFCGAGLLY